MSSWEDKTASGGELTDRAFNGDIAAQREINYHAGMFDPSPQPQSQNPSYHTGGSGQTHEFPGAAASVRAILVWGVVFYVLYRTGWAAHALTDQAAFSKMAGMLTAGAFVTSRYLREKIIGLALLLGLLFVTFNIFMYLTTGRMPGLLKPATVPPSHQKAVPNS